ncbi:MAG: 2-C-methyl-D-erythritol 4-phosphate cytidylyltransferase [bacterium]
MGDEKRHAVRVAAVVLAAGSSSRMSGHDKIYAPLAGRPLVYYGLALFEDCEEVEAVVAVAGPGSENKLRRLASNYGFDKVRAVVAGGAVRRDSAASGLAAAAALASADAAVLIHDAARPLATRALVRRLLAALATADGAVPAVPLVDTVKQIGADGAVESTLTRDALRAAQTPQAFKLAAVAEAYRAAAREKWDVTDDAAAVERAGGRVVSVEGERDNFKITFPEDLARAEAVLTLKKKGR